MLNSNNIVWKPVKGLEDRYEVSSTGLVKSIQTNHGKHQSKLLKPVKTTTSPYWYVNITVKNCTKKKSIHRLVAEAFIPNSLNKSTVNHIDGNKLNNNVCNLEWATQSENLKHAFAIGLSTPTRGTLAKKLSKCSKYFYVTYDQSRNRYVACVKILRTRKSLQANFACSKYGSALAEQLAAKKVNEFLDSLLDVERPRNIIT